MTNDLVERVAHVDTLRQELVRASTMTEAELDALVAHAINVIRNEALEEAAKVCDERAKQQAEARDEEKYEGSPDWHVYNQGAFIASGIAAAIRAMIPNGNDPKLVPFIDTE